LKLKCTKFDFGLGSTPDPSGGAYSAPRCPLAGFLGPTSKGREERKDEEGESKGGEGRGGDLLLRRGGRGERKGEGRVSSPKPKKQTLPMRRVHKP